jgi:hypothetical protein
LDQHSVHRLGRAVDRGRQILIIESAIDQQAFCLNRPGADDGTWPILVAQVRPLMRRSGRWNTFQPMMGEIGTPTDPYVVMRPNMLQKAFQGGDSGGPADDSAVEPD